MIRNDICLGGESKQNARFSKKMCFKNVPMSSMSRIGPGSMFFLLWEMSFYKVIFLFLQIAFVKGEKNHRWHQYKQVLYKCYKICKYEIYIQNTECADNTENIERWKISFP